MTAGEYPLHRIVRRRFRPEETGSIDFLRSPRPWSFFRTRRDGVVAEDELHGAHWLPWLWDPRRNCMLFLRLPAELDLTRVSFVYHSMRLHATHVAEVPMNDFRRMAKQHRVGGTRIVWLYNVGRCGSTLLSHAISDATPSEGLSETAYHLQVLRLRRWMTDDQKVEYMQLMTHWYAERFAPTDPTGRLVIKIPHPCTVIHGLIDASVPEARALFMYRDARKVVASAHRVSGSIHGKTRWAFRTPILRWVAALVAMGFASLFAPWFRTVDGSLEGATGRALLKQHGFVAILTLMWATDVSTYLAMRTQRKVPAIRYEDLTAEAFPSILGQLGLGAVDESSLAKVLSRDSQAGTALGRKRKGIPLDERDLAVVERIVRDHTAIEEPEAVLPGTVSS